MRRFTGDRNAPEQSCLAKTRALPRLLLFDAIHDRPPFHRVPTTTLRVPSPTPPPPLNYCLAVLFLHAKRKYRQTQTLFIQSLKRFAQSVALCSLFTKASTTKAIHLAPRPFTQPTTCLVTYSLESWTLDLFLMRLLLVIAPPVPSQVVFC